MSPAVAAGPDLLRGLLPPERVVTGDDTDDWAVVGRAPRAVAFPESAKEVAAIVERARREGLALEPAGAGGWLAAGNPGRPVDVVVSTARMDEVTRYEPGDLTLTAGAGTPLRALARRVAAERQWLAVDPPGHGGTLGALAATGVAGPLQAGYGTPRDLVLGMEVVTGEGRILQLGGRVVKNVAGFDLVRLMVGSRGTLGIVTSVTVRLHPLPAVDRTWWLEGERIEDLLPVASSIAAAPVTPAAVELVERHGGPGEGARTRLAVRMVGSEARVEAEARVLEDAAGRPLEPAAEADARAFWEAMREADLDADLALRLSMPPGDARGLLQVARALGRVRGGRDELERAPVSLSLHVTRGVLRVLVPNLRTDSGWDVRWGERLGDVRRTLEARGGGLIVSRAPLPVLREVGAWGDPGPAARLMREIKFRFDPDDVLSPGRFVVPDRDHGGDDGQGGDHGVPSTNEDV